VNSLDTLDRRSVVATYAEVLNSQKIRLNTQESLQVPDNILKDYTMLAVVLPDANVLELTVIGPSPALAAQLANSLGYEAILFSRQLNMSFDLNFLDEAPVTELPVSPVPLKDAGIALVLGLFAGGTIAILSEQIRIPLEAYRQRLRIDGVTGVYTARYFRELLNQELTRAPDEALAIGIIELRGLRDFTDSLPFSGLQTLLQEATSRLRKELRGHDIVGLWKDTSFIVMLPSTNGAPAKRTFDRIYQALSKEVYLESYDIRINLDPYIGGAVYSNLITVQELITKAVDSLEQTRVSRDEPVYLWMMNSPFWVEK
jgi:diguanylate cyclase (GGDEF)-like protein